MVTTEKANACSPWTFCSSLKNTFSEGLIEFLITNQQMLNIFSHGKINVHAWTRILLYILNTGLQKDYLSKKTNIGCYCRVLFAFLFSGRKIPSALLLVLNNKEMETFYSSWGFLLILYTASSRKLQEFEKKSSYQKLLLKVVTM